MRLCLDRPPSNILKLWSSLANPIFKIYWVRSDIGPTLLWFLVEDFLVCLVKWRRAVSWLESREVAADNVGLFNPLMGPVVLGGLGGASFIRHPGGAESGVWKMRLPRLTRAHEYVVVCPPTVMTSSSKRLSRGRRTDTGPRSIANLLASSSFAYICVELCPWSLSMIF